MRRISIRLVLALASAAFPLVHHRVARQMSAYVPKSKRTWHEDGRKSQKSHSAKGLKNGRVQKRHRPVKRGK